MTHRGGRVGGPTRLRSIAPSTCSSTWPWAATGPATPTADPVPPGDGDRLGARLPEGTGTPGASCPDDMDHADPLGNDWFVFSAHRGGTLAGDTNELPPYGGDRVLYGSFDSAGTPGSWAARRTERMSLGDATHFELGPPRRGVGRDARAQPPGGRQRDDVIPASPDGSDDEFQTVLTIGAGPDLSRGGWQHRHPADGLRRRQQLHVGRQRVPDAGLPPPAATAVVVVIALFSQAEPRSACARTSGGSPAGPAPSRATSSTTRRNGQWQGEPGSPACGPSSSTRSAAPCWTRPRPTSSGAMPERHDGGRPRGARRSDHPRRSSSHLRQRRHRHRGHHQLRPRLRRDRRAGLRLHDLVRRRRPLLLARRPELHRAPRALERRARRSRSTT